MHFMALDIRKRAIKGSKSGSRRRSRLWAQVNPKQNRSRGDLGPPTTRGQLPIAFINMTATRPSRNRNRSRSWRRSRSPLPFAPLCAAAGKLTAAAAQFECKPQNWIISQWQSKRRVLLPSCWYMRPAKSFPGAGHTCRWWPHRVLQLHPRRAEYKRQWVYVPALWGEGSQPSDLGPRLSYAK